MNTPSTIDERLRLAFATPTRGILGLVDDLLALSCERDLRLAWHAGQCQVRLTEADFGTRIDVPCRQSVVRAALARVAVLCNERFPNSVSPYGGQSELVIDTHPVTAIRVSFVNTPEVQSLELVSMRMNAATVKEGVLTGDGGTHT